METGSINIVSLITSNHSRQCGDYCDYLVKLGKLRESQELKTKTKTMKESFKEKKNISQFVTCVALYAMPFAKTGQ